MERVYSNNWQWGSFSKSVKTSIKVYKYPRQEEIIRKICVAIILAAHRRGFASRVAQCCFYIASNCMSLCDMMENSHIYIYIYTIYITYSCIIYRIYYYLYITYICNTYTMNPHICIQLDGMPAGSPYI